MSTVGGRGGGGASWKLKKAAKKLLVQTCGSFSRRHRSPVLDSTVLSDSQVIAESASNSCQIEHSTFADQLDSAAKSASNKNLCAICLDPLNYSSGSSPGQAIFTAQCSHAFHFDCISSNVKHGSVTCPICRSLWTKLPRSLHNHCTLHRTQADPILQILDDSIANFRVHRRSFLRSARYDDDDPIDPDDSINLPRLHFSLEPVPLNPMLFDSLLANRAYLSVKLAHHPPTDLVLVASPNGPHLRLMKQAMALVVFGLRPIDRLAIVTYSSAASRIFPLRRMTSYGKRTVLQVIDRLFYTGQADSTEGLTKGAKILRDRTHQNPHSLMVHLSDSPTISYDTELSIPIPIHKFHVGFGFRFGASSGFFMSEFEGFLGRILGGAVREVQLRIGEGSRVVRLGELRAGEERRVPLILGDAEQVHVEYRYEDVLLDDCVRTGEIAVGIDDKRESVEGSLDSVQSILGRPSSVESWEYHDPFMARRWAKHLHGYRG